VVCYDVPLHLKNLKDIPTHILEMQTSLRQFENLKDLPSGIEKLQTLLNEVHELDPLSKTLADIKSALIPAQPEYVPLHQRLGL